MPPEKSYSGRMSSVSLDLLGFLFVAMAFASRREAGGYDPNLVREVEVRNLSHGERRQVEVVLGLASDPKILLLDEPAAGLATGESQDMTAFLKRLDPELAILLIEHDMHVVFDFADHISVLHFGQVVEEGSTDHIRGSGKVQEIYLGTG